MIKALTYLLHSFRYLCKVPACDDIGIVKKQVEKSVAVALSIVVFRPQQAGATRSITEFGTASPALFTPKPCAPGELNANVAGEL